jgi:phosphoribosylformylglycinamidine synthase
MVLSARLKKDIYKLNNFVENGGFILGVCNGFQVLVNLGLLPNIKNNNNEVALIENEDGKFINDWVNLKVNEKSNSPFFKGISEIFLPIRNQEGRLIVGDNSIKNKIIENNLNVLTYIKNPNGSELDIAGLTDNSKHILGLMPHPEAFLSIYNHPNWAKLKKDNPNIPEIGEGLTIFKNIVEYIIENN